MLEFIFEVLVEAVVTPTPASVTNIGIYWLHGILRVCVGIAGIVLFGYLVWMSNIWWIDMLLLVIIMGVVYFISKKTAISIKGAYNLKNGDERQ